MQLSVYAPAPPLRIDIDALNPPELGIPPIAPFICDQALSDDHPGTSVFRHVKRSPIGPVENSQGPLPQTVWIQGSPFRFPGHGRTKAGQRLDIIEAGGSYYDVFRDHRRAD
jgi:hypothetical protein